MTRANSIDELIRLVNSYSRRISNDYLLPAAYAEMINRGKLSYIADDSGLYLFETRNGYYKLYFRLNETATLPEIDGSLVTNTVYKGEPKDSAPEKWLKDNGFVLRLERHRYMAEELLIEPEKPVITDASEAYPVYNACFDLLTADLPCKDSFEGALCVRNNANETVGVLSLGLDRHIAVLPEYRGKGISMRLYAMLKAHYDSPEKLRVWTDRNNAASNAMYGKLGFKLDGMTARCYVREV
jgi:GNAT superfamily N-acetyltransferase